MWTWKTTTHFKDSLRDDKIETRRKRGGGRQNDVVGCRRVLQLREQLHHPKKTLVGDGDDFVVVDLDDIEGRLRDTTPTTRPFLSTASSRRSDRNDDDDDSEVVFKKSCAVYLVASRRTAPVRLTTSMNDVYARSMGSAYSRDDDVR